MNKSLNIKRLVDPDIEKGDKIRIIDGSGLICIDSNQDVYIANSYPWITGIDNKLEKIVGEVIRTGVKKILSESISYSNSCYAPDVIIQLGNAKFYTCSQFLIKVEEIKYEFCSCCCNCCKQNISSHKKLSKLLNKLEQL